MRDSPQSKGNSLEEQPGFYDSDLTEELNIDLATGFLHFPPSNESQLGLHVVPLTSQACVAF